MKSRKEQLKERLINDPMFEIVSNLTESDMDEINEVSISTFNKNINEINNPLAVRGLWENGLNRKLTSIFVNLIKNVDAFTELNNQGHILVDVDKNHNINIIVVDFFMNDYNFERSVMDNNIREYTFYYNITDDSAEDNPILIKGRFDLDISVMYVDQDNYEDITGEEMNSDIGYELSYEVTNKIFFNKYITEDYLNDNYEEILDKEVMLLESIFNDLDVELINDMVPKNK